MKVAVFGAGNIGLASACAISSKVETVLFSRRAAASRVQIEFVYEDRKPKYVEIRSTASLEEALKADLILCTYPAFMREEFVASIAPICRPGQSLGFMPGYGGAEYFARDLVEKGVTLFGLQRVPYVARSSWDAKEAAVLSAKTELYLAALPKSRTCKVAQTIGSLFDIPTVPLKDYIAVTLAPSNPLLHTSGTYTALKGRSADDAFPQPLKFYEEWSDETSQLLLDFDDELQQVCRALLPLDASEVVSLRTYYEAPTPDRMTQKLKSIKAFEVVKVPLRQCGAEYRIDLENRMFTEDFPFGVAIIKGMGMLVGVETPVADKLLGFYSSLTGTNYFNPDGTLSPSAACSGVPQAHGICSKDELVGFYRS